MKHLRKGGSPDPASASVNMTGRGREPRRGSHASDDTPCSSPDPDYCPGLGEVLVREDGVFRNTRSRVAIPYNYEQPSSSTDLTALQPRRSPQSSDGEDEDSGYASSATVSSVRTDKASVNMADNANDDLRRRLEAQEQTSRTQHVTPRSWNTYLVAYSDFDRIFRFASRIYFVL